MSASRTELIQWLNELLQLNYTKVEQCGTGAAYCQILDSIYGSLLDPAVIDVFCGLISVVTSFYWVEYKAIYQCRE